MIFLTGDTHGDLEINKLSKKNLTSKGINPSKDDYVIITGDFGLIWKAEASNSEKYWLKWLDEKPFTTLFIDGNHENFNRLNSYPIEQWHNGNVHRISKNVFHLMRGNVYEICNKKIFTFGGATSHDRAWRTEGISWWPQEMPSEDELAYAITTLAEHNNTVDYIVTHCAPSLVQARFSLGYERDRLTEFFEYLRETVAFKTWYFGHYHEDRRFDDGFISLYDDVVPLDTTPKART